uniref:Dynein_AAA_lid domain-containing protein n=1 Tax=Steinernema glaseri TaxID=37863 RepID=A0A1I7YMV4_9BILA
MRCLSPGCCDLPCFSLPPSMASRTHNVSVYGGVLCPLDLSCTASLPSRLMAFCAVPGFGPPQPLSLNLTSFELGRLQELVDGLQVEQYDKFLVDRVRQVFPHQVGPCFDPRSAVNSLFQWVLSGQRKTPPSCSSARSFGIEGDVSFGAMNQLSQMLT